MKTATAKDLHLKTAAVIEEVRRGREVRITYRGRPIGVLVPVDKTPRRGFRPVGFGIWAERRDLENVERWIDGQRRSRFERSSSTRTS